MIQYITNYAAANCYHFLNFPTWYEYLPGTCSNVRINGINDIWLIVAAVIEILLQVAGMFAVGFIIYGGFEYLTSQAEPDKINKARMTIINALVGLAIAVMAAVIVNFIARSIQTN